MASITNRSAFTVTVPGYRGKDKNKYTRTIVYSKLKDAEAYMSALIEQGLTPDIAQSEDTFQVKVIRKGCSATTRRRPRPPPPTSSASTWTRIAQA